MGETDRERQYIWQFQGSFIYSSDFALSGDKKKKVFTDDIRKIDLKMNKDGQSVVPHESFKIDVSSYNLWIRF